MKTCEYKFQGIFVIAVAASVIFWNSTVYGIRQSEVKEVISMKAQAENEEKKVVQPNTLAGSWYSANSKSLQKQLQTFLEQADVKPKNNVIALIQPHAGYQYSGQTAAYGIKIAGKQYKRIIVIGPSHAVNMPGVLSLPAVTHYTTPLGEIAIDTETVKELLEEPMFKNIPQAHAGEHSVQIHLPLIQCAQKNFKLVPIVAGQCNAEQIIRAGNIIRRFVDEETLVVASSDFVHYGPRFDYVPFTKNVPEEIEKVDMGAYEYIAKLDSSGLMEYKGKTGATICGIVPIAIVLAMCDKDSKPELLKYTTSGEMMNDFSSSVSYLCAAFTGKWQKKESKGLTEKEKHCLLKLARESLVYYLEKKKQPELSDLNIEATAAMGADRAAFVTLKKDSHLRGCIGDIFPRGTLYDSVIRNAVNAGVNDWRFKPVTRAECDSLTIEISALTPPEPVGSAKDIRIGTDGVVLRKNGRSAVFLPQVAPEQGWGVEETLTHLATKAGLKPDDWKEGAKFLVFQAEVFGENEK
jgi:hypothetical protein